MSKRLYVGNLPFSVKTQQLTEMFSSCGEVEEAEVVSFKDSEKSKGFGFVTFKNDSDADKAIEEFNGKEIEGRQIKVNEAAPFDPNKPKKRFERRRFDRRPFRNNSRRDFNNSNNRNRANNREESDM